MPKSKTPHKELYVGDGSTRIYRDGAGKIIVEDSQGTHTIADLSAGDHNHSLNGLTSKAHSELTGVGGDGDYHLSSAQRTGLVTGAQTSLHAHDYAAGDHNHSGVYAADDHNHSGVYAPSTHSHSLYAGGRLVLNARISGTDVSTSSVTPFTINWNSIDLDADGGYNASTDKYDIKATGTYLIVLHLPIRLLAQFGISTSHVKVLVNGALVDNMDVYTSVTGVTNGANFYLTGSLVRSRSLTLGDDVWVTAVGAGASSWLSVGASWQLIQLA